MMAGAKLSKVLYHKFDSTTRSHVDPAERPLASCAVALMLAAALVIATAPRLCAQTNRAQPTKEYIYLGGRVIAVESGLAMLSPVPGSTLPGGSVTFTWTAVSGASQYSLWLGSTLGGNDLGAAPLLAGTSYSATVPGTGATLHVRLWAEIGGVWQHVDYTYTEADFVARMISPVPGSTLAGGSVSFTWTAGMGVTQYSLWFGSAPGGNDLGAAPLLAGTSYSATVPVTGATLYVRLWSLIAGAWQYIDYAYTEADLVARMITPTPGSLLSGVFATFIWTAGSGVTQYSLWFGSTAGGYDFGAAPLLTGTSFTTALPNTSGITLYVRLWSLIGGVWQYVDYTYTH